MACIALGESARAFFAVSRFPCRRQRFKDHPHFRRPSAHYRVQFTLGHTTSTITGPDFVCSGFSRHIPANFASAITALTAAEARLSRP